MCFLSILFLSIVSDKFGQKYDLFILLGTGQSLLGGMHGAGAKGHGADTFLVL